MIDIVYKGILIGILVSAPMGPIGLLCIQRTLNKGRWHGFATGIGAVFSDLIYAIATGLSMGIVVSFIEDHQAILQVFGGVMLMAFGFYIYRSNPTKSLRKPDEVSNTYTQDIITSFFLTLSNPFIIFLFLGLFARFRIISTEGTTLDLIVGLSSVALGATLWWFVITFFIGKLRGNFNLRGLWILNRIVGVIIMVFSIGGLAFSFWEYCNI